MPRKFYRSDKGKRRGPSRDMSHTPYSAETIEVEKDDDQGVRARMLLLIPHDTIRPIGAVIVESWDDVVPRGIRAGSKNRKYKEAFTEEERKQLGTWHTKMYGWELRTGYPQEVGMHLSTFNLLRRAADFFASV